MPELPEVETVRCLLEPRLDGQKIKNIWCDSKKLLNSSLKKYRNVLLGKKIVKVDRRSKLLAFELSEGYFLAIHLKMTGQLIFVGKRAVSSLPNKFSHFIFYFNSGDKLYFNDVRKFGYIKLFTREQFKQELQKLNYGVEPLSQEFTVEYLTSIIKKYPKRPIKQVLMDQTLIAGLGNIYVDESLFGSRVQPKRRARLLTRNEIKRLQVSIVKVIKKAIVCGGSSISDYINPLGEQGTYGQHHKVYGRSGEACYECKTILKSTKIGGRTSTYCSKCQS